MTELIVVGGPNGAGKTTFIMEYQKQHPLLYFGADAIALELSATDPQNVALSASREFLHRIESAISQLESMIVESTLSGRTFQRIINSAKAAGYDVTILFLWLDSADSSLARVQERVAKGGHDVPEADIRRRFLRCLRNFWNYYRPLSDHWGLTYNSSKNSENVAVGTAEGFTIFNSALFAEFQRLIQEPSDD